MSSESLASALGLKSWGQEARNPQEYRFLGYALSARPVSNETVRIAPDLVFDLAHLGEGRSFLSFSGVVLFAGAYESYNSGDEYASPSVICADRNDLSLRIREATSLLEQGKLLVFLVPNLPVTVGYHKISDNIDLFRRILAERNIRWGTVENGPASVDCKVSEFREYVERYGAGWLVYPSVWLKDIDHVVICEHAGSIYGMVLSDQIFVLPSVAPRDERHGVEIAQAAIKAVVAYRKRISAEPPEWVDEFVFQEEATLREQVGRIKGELSNTEKQIAAFARLKEVLYCRSTPLVDAVGLLLKDCFGLNIVVDDKCVEDAAMTDSNGKIEAVFEIKGINANFRRCDVNQVDSHRERLKLSANVPGVLVMNTIMGAASLAEKDVEPHHEIIRKAVDSNVLLVRTLDLLKLIDLMGKGQVVADIFKQQLSFGGGWMKVDGAGVRVIKSQSDLGGV